MADKRISAISIYLLSKSSAVRLPLSLGTGYFGLTTPPFSVEMTPL